MFDKSERLDNREESQEAKDKDAKFKFLNLNSAVHDVR